MSRQELCRIKNRAILHQARTMPYTSYAIGKNRAVIDLDKNYAIPGMHRCESCTRQELCHTSLYKSQHKMPRFLKWKASSGCLKTRQIRSMSNLLTKDLICNKRAKNVPKVCQKCANPPCK